MKRKSRRRERSRSWSDRRVSLRDAVQRHRRPNFEQLERHLLLSADLDSSQADALRDGLAAIAAFADRLDDYGPLSQTMPLVATSLGSALDVGGVLRTLLVDPAQAYLQGTGLTSDGLAEALRDELNGTTEYGMDAGWSVSSGVAAADELWFERELCGNAQR